MSAAPPPSGTVAPVLLEPRTRRVRVLLLLALLLVPQFILFGPSLVGAKVLLPVDLLNQPGIYMPNAPQERGTDFVLSDLVYELEPERIYGVEAVRSGRLPLWNPLIYCGTPFLAANHTSVFYPLRAIDYLVPGPIAVAWVQLVKSLLAGLGMYLFLRRVPQLSYWPCAIGAALWPNVGFLMLWAGYTISQVGAHLPWVLLATDACLRKPKSLWPLALALATAVTLVSGHASIAAHVLLAAGLFALFRCFDLHGRAALRRAWPGIGALCLGVGLGVGLSGPQTLPTLEYMQESWRIQKRQEGRVETPPIGPVALPAVLMPYIDGSTQRHTTLIRHGNRLESSHAAYAGLLTALVLVPLGFGLRRLWRMHCFWLALGFLGLTSILGVPLLKEFFELPVLNTLRNNRFTLVTAFALVALAASGLELVVRGQFRWRGGYFVAVGLAALVVLFCIARANGTPDLRPEFRTEEILRWFRRVSIGYALLAAVALFLWWRLARGGGAWSRTPQCALLLGLLPLAEVVQQGYDANVQGEHALYFPRHKVIERLQALPPGRFCGMGSFPASLNLAVGLDDIRGYDAADPARIVELYTLFKNENAPPGSDYAALQWWFPRLPHGLADAVHLRYLLAYAPGRTFPGTLFSEGGWHVQERTECPPRAWIAARGELANDKTARLARLADPRFDARQVVVLESPEPLPTDSAPGAGSARFELDEAERVVLALEVQSPGWLVLADRWTDGWKASLDGRDVPVLCANHAFRAVRVAPGDRRLEFRYEPPSWRQGWILGLSSALLCAGWFAFARPRRAP